MGLQIKNLFVLTFKCHVVIHGAKEEGGLSQALLVLCKGPIHKDRHDNDDQVAVWCYKEYNTVNFFHLDKCQCAPWWDKEIIDKNNKDGECSSDGLHSCASISYIHCCAASAHKKRERMQ
jgi:hypothetical protein